METLFRTFFRACWLQQATGSGSGCCCAILVGIILEAIGCARGYASIAAAQGNVFHAFELLQYQSVHTPESLYTADKTLYRQWQFGKLAGLPVPVRLADIDITRISGFLSGASESLPDFLIRVLWHFDAFFYGSGISHGSGDLSLCFDVNDPSFRANLLTEYSSRELDCQRLKTRSGAPVQQQYCRLSLSEATGQNYLAITGGRFNSACSLELNKNRPVGPAPGNLAMVVYSGRPGVTQPDTGRNNTGIPLLPKTGLPPDRTETSSSGGWGDSGDHPDDNRRKPFLSGIPLLELSIVLPGWPVVDLVGETSPSLLWSVDDSGGQTGVVIGFRMNGQEQYLRLTLDQWQLLVEHGIHRSPALLYFLVCSLARGELKRQQLQEELRFWLERQDTLLLSNTDNRDTDLVTAMIVSTLRDLQDIPPEEIALEAVLASFYEAYLARETGWQPAGRNPGPHTWLQEIKLIVTLLASRDKLTLELRHWLAQEGADLQFGPVGHLTGKEMQALLREQIRVLWLEVIQHILKRERPVNTPGQQPGRNQNLSPARPASATSPEAQPSPGSTGLSKNTIASDSSRQEGPPLLTGALAREEKQESGETMLVPTYTRVFANWVQVFRDNGTITDYATPFCSLLINRLLTLRLRWFQVEWFWDYLVAGLHVSPEVKAQREANEEEEIEEEIEEEEIGEEEIGEEEIEVEINALKWLQLRIVLIGFVKEMNKQLANWNPSMSIEERQKLISRLCDLCQDQVQIINQFDQNLVPTREPELYNWVTCNKLGSGDLNFIAHTFFYPFLSQQVSEEPAPDWLMALATYCGFNRRFPNTGLAQMPVEDIDGPGEPGLTCRALPENPDIDFPTLISIPVSAEYWASHYAFAQQGPRQKPMAGLEPLLHGINQVTLLLNLLHGLPMNCLMRPDSAFMPHYRDSEIFKGEKKIYGLLLQSLINIFLAITDSSSPLSRISLAFSLSIYLQELGLHYPLELTSHWNQFFLKLVGYIRDILDGRLAAGTYGTGNAIKLLTALNEIRGHILISESFSEKLSQANQDLIEYLLARQQFSQAAQYVFKFAEQGNFEPALFLRFTWQWLLVSSKPMAVSGILHDDLDTIPFAGLSNIMTLCQFISGSRQNYEPDIYKAVKDLTWLSYSGVDKESDPQPDWLVSSFWEVAPESFLAFMVSCPVLFLQVMDSLRQDSEDYIQLIEEGPVDLIHAQDPDVIHIMTRKSLFLIYCNKLLLNPDSPSHILLLYLFDRLGFFFETINSFRNEPFTLGLGKIERTIIDAIVLVLNNKPADALTELSTLQSLLVKKTGQNQHAALEKTLRKVMLKTRQAQQHRGRNINIDRRHDKKATINAPCEDTPSATAPSEPTYSKPIPVEEAIPQKVITSGPKVRKIGKSRPKPKNPLSFLSYGQLQTLAIKLAALTGMTESAKEHPILDKLNVDSELYTLDSLFIGIKYLRQGQNCLPFFEASKDPLAYFLAGQIYLRQGDAASRKKAFDYFSRAIHIYGCATASLFQFDEPEPRSLTGGLERPEDPETRLLVQWRQRALPDNPESMAGLIESLTRGIRVPQVFFRMSALLHESGIDNPEYHLGLIRRFFKYLTTLNDFFFINDPYRDEFIFRKIFDSLLLLPIDEGLVFLEQSLSLAPERKEAIQLRLQLHAASYFDDLLPEQYRGEYLGKILKLTHTVANLDLIVLAKTLRETESIPQALLAIATWEPPAKGIMQLLMKLNRVCGDCIVAGLGLDDQLQVWDSLGERQAYHPYEARYFKSLTRLVSSGALRELNKTLVTKVLDYLRHSSSPDFPVLDRWLNGLAVFENRPVSGIYSDHLYDALTQPRHLALPGLIPYLLGQLERTDDGKASKTLARPLKDKFFQDLPVRDSDHSIRLFSLVQRLDPYAMSTQDAVRLSEHFRKNQAESGDIKWLDELFPWIITVRDQLRHDEFARLALNLMPYIRKNRPRNEAVEWLEYGSSQEDKTTTCTWLEQLVQDVFTWSAPDHDWLTILQGSYGRQSQGGHDTGPMVDMLMRQLHSAATGKNSRIPGIMLMDWLGSLMPPGFQPFWQYLTIYPGKTRQTLAYLLNDHSLKPKLQQAISEHVAPGTVTELVGLVSHSPRQHMDVLESLLRIPELREMIGQQELLAIVQNEIAGYNQPPLSDTLLQSLAPGTLLSLKPATLLRLVLASGSPEVRQHLFDQLYQGTSGQLPRLPAEAFETILAVILNADHFLPGHFLAVVGQLPSLPHTKQQGVYRKVVPKILDAWFGRFCLPEILGTMSHWAREINGLEMLDTKSYNTFFDVMALVHSDDITPLVTDCPFRGGPNHFVVEPLQVFHQLASPGQRLQAGVYKAIKKLVSECILLDPDDPQLKLAQACFYWCFMAVHPQQLLKLLNTKEAKNVIDTISQYVSGNSVRQRLFELDGILEKEKYLSEIDRPLLWKRVFVVQRLKMLEKNPGESQQVELMLTRAKASWGALLLNVFSNPESSYAQNLGGKDIQYQYFRQEEVKTLLTPELLTRLSGEFLPFIQREEAWRQLLASLVDSTTCEVSAEVEGLATAVLGPGQLLPENVHKEWLGELARVIQDKLGKAEYSTDAMGFMDSLLTSKVSALLPGELRQQIEHKLLSLHYRSLAFLVYSTTVDETSRIDEFEELERKILTYHPAKTPRKHVQKINDTLKLSWLLKLRIGLWKREALQLTQQVLETIDSIPTPLPQVNRLAIAEAVLHLSKQVTEPGRQAYKRVLTESKLMDTLLCLEKEASHEQAWADTTRSIYEQIALLHRPGYLSREGDGDRERQYWHKALVYGSQKAIRKLRLDQHLLHKLRRLKAGVAEFNKKGVINNLEELSGYARDVEKADRLNEYPEGERILDSWRQCGQQRKGEWSNTED